MELRDAVLGRRMVRTYDPDRPVPDAVITLLIELAVRAPSAGNSQGRDVLVLSQAAERERFWRTTSPDVDAPDPWLAGMMTAPTLLVLLADPGAYAARYREPDKSRAAAEREELAGPAQPVAGAGSPPVPWWDVDTGMAALLLLLSAVDEGLGACFFGVPPPATAAVLAAFGVPPDRRVVGVVSVGHPAADRRSPSLRRPRRQVGQVAHRGRFGVPWHASEATDEGP